MRWYERDLAVGRSLGIATMHVPASSERMEWVGRQEAVLAHDPRISWFVSEDPHRNGVWWNYKQTAERLLKTDVTHVLVLQDDFVLCDHFVDGCLRLLELKPDRIVSIFHMRPKVAAVCAEQGTEWFTDIDRIYGALFVCPIGFVRDFLEWSALKIRPDFRPEDVRWAMWSRYADASPKEIWLTAQSLIQHEGSGKSLLGHRRPNNRAPRFCPDAHEVEWERGIDRPYRAPSVQNKEEVRSAWLA